MSFDDEVTLGPLNPHGTRTMVLNRPQKANAINDPLVAALEDALARAKSDGTRLLVVTGNGHNFCGGFDFTDFRAIPEPVLGERLIAVGRALQRLREAPFVSIAVVNGPAFGAGGDIAVACTYRIGYDTARFRFPGFRFGVALGTQALARTIGSDRAREILLQDEILDADASLSAGLLTHRASLEGAAALVDAIELGLSSLEPWAQSTILQLTRAATADDEIEVLAASVHRPGLHDRIAAYQSYARARGRSTV